MKYYNYSAYSIIETIIPGKCKMIADDMCIYLILVRESCNICEEDKRMSYEHFWEELGSRDAKEIANPVVRRRRGTMTNQSHISL